MAQCALVCSIIGKQCSLHANNNKETLIMHYVHITKHSSDLYKGMAKVLPIIDVLGYDGQNSSFSYPLPPPRSDSTPITQKGSHIINMKLCGFIHFCNDKRLVILTCL